ncbi:MAG TPA: glycosyltransferase [Candidatus Acidoferrum sp.]
MTDSATSNLDPCITAIVPARNEESTIAVCVESLASQPEIAEIIVVDDQSTDNTATILRNLSAQVPQLRLMEAPDLPPGWTGKNHAISTAAKTVTTPWILLTDADAELLPNAAARALEVSRDSAAALVSFSPEQIAETWYEKSLIPFIYCRLAARFSYEAVNDPASKAAAANGQFLMIRRDAYEAIGGHGGVAGEVLEDVALALRAKEAGYRLWFGSGIGAVRVRMYRSFAAMWQGWAKNIYTLIGGTPEAVRTELLATIPWIPFILIMLGLRFPVPLLAGVIFLLVRQAKYGFALSRNHYPPNFILYYVPALLLYAAVLCASYRNHKRGRVQWRGRAIEVGVPGGGPGATDKQAPVRDETGKTQWSF